MKLIIKDHRQHPLIILSTCECQRAEVVDRVIAIVNDDIITMKDFEAFMKIERAANH